MDRRLVAGSLGVLVVLLIAAGFRVAEHERNAWVAVSPRGLALGPEPQVLVERSVVRGREVAFEVCSRALRSPLVLPTGVTLGLRDVGANEIALTQVLDESMRRRVRSTPELGCIEFARSASFGIDGRVAIVASSATATVSAATSAASMPFIGRIVARRRLDGTDRGLIAALALASLGSLASIARARRRDPPSDDSAALDTAHAPTLDSKRTRGVLLFGIASLLIGFVFVRFMPWSGATGGFSRGVGLLVAQIAAIGAALIMFNDTEARTLLGTDPPRKVVLFVVAPLLAVAVQLVAQGLIRLIPATGVSAVERLVDPTAGTAHVEVVLASMGGVLAFGAVAVVAPIVEELYFRGLVYGCTRTLAGPVWAFAAAFGLFVLGHLTQLDGARAALASLTVISLVATSFRALTRSTVAPAVMHWVHNALVVGLALSQAA